MNSTGYPEFDEPISAPSTLSTVLVYTAWSKFKVPCQPPLSTGIYAQIYVPFFLISFDEEKISSCKNKKDQAQLENIIWMASKIRYAVRNEPASRLTCLGRVKRKWWDREGHWGRRLGYVDSSKVIFSLRRKRKCVSRDVRTEWSLFPTANCRCRNTIFHHFETRFYRQTVSPRYPPLFCFHWEHHIEVGLDADVSENILPFESPSINNFSGIDISQGLDREFPSLFPYFLLVGYHGQRSWREEWGKEKWLFIAGFASSPVLGSLSPLSVIPYQRKWACLHSSSQRIASIRIL